MCRNTIPTGAGDNYAMYTKSGKENGYTLIEVMVALAIFSFGMLGVVGMFTTSISANAQGKHFTEATSLATSKLNYLQTAEAYEDLTNGSESGVTIDGSSNGVKYNVTWGISAVPGFDMKRITVFVSWVSKGHTHSVNLSSLRAADK